MKVVILAGGLGSRLSEESHSRPKPMIEIGGRPILWHIMKIYSSFGLNEFVICCGYKSYVIKEYFANYYLHQSDVTFDLRDNSVEIHNNTSEPWKVTLVDTGSESMTGGRIKRVLPYVGNKPFCMTYGDGVADVNISKLIDFHFNRTNLVTVTSVVPSGRFGALEINEENIVTEFVEKPPGDNQRINGGFFVIDPRAIDYIKGDSSVWENEPLKNLARDGQLSSFIHDGFWQPMDTLRDKNLLEELWNSGKAPWKIWTDFSSKKREKSSPAETQSTSAPLALLGY